MKPMWSWWAMRTEAVAVLYWGLAGKVLLEHLQGTPFLPWILRLLGVKFGQGVCMHTTDITEFDCVKVGDFCSINAMSALQTHLYEDRVMKVGRVELGRGVTVGANATVLYDTHIGDYAQLRPLTIIMKASRSRPTASGRVRRRCRSCTGPPGRPSPSRLSKPGCATREVTSAALRRKRRDRFHHVPQHLRPSLPRHHLRREPRAGARLRRRRLPAGIPLTEADIQASSTGAGPASRASPRSDGSRTRSASCPALSATTAWRVR
jgi:hypothetical protein